MRFLSLVGRVIEVATITTTTTSDDVRRVLREWFINECSLSNEMKWFVIVILSVLVYPLCLLPTYLSCSLPGWNCENPTYLRCDVPFKISRLGSKSIDEPHTLYAR